MQAMVDDGEVGALQEPKDAEGDGHDEGDPAQHGGVVQVVEPGGQLAAKRLAWAGVGW